MLLDVLCVLVGKSRGAPRVAGRTPSPAVRAQAPRGLVCSGGGVGWGPQAGELWGDLGAHIGLRAPPPPPPPPRPSRVAEGLRPPAGAVTHAGGSPGSGRPGARPGAGHRREDLHPHSRDRRSPRAHSAARWDSNPPSQAGWGWGVHRWRERLGPGLRVDPSPPAAQTKPVGRVCGPGWGRGWPEAAPLPAPPPGSREQRLSVCSGAVRTMAPEFYPPARGGAPSGLSRTPHPLVGFLHLRRDGGR